MKSRKIIFSSLVLSLSAFAILFISCSQQPIFYAIDKEIKLEKSVVGGNVYSIIDANGRLYAANGKIFSKAATDIRGWDDESKPDGHIIGLAAGYNTSSVYLYAISASASGEKSLFGKKLGDGWTKIDSINGTLNSVFGNNAQEGTNKVAYIATSSGTYKLEGLTVNATAETEANASSVKAAFITGPKTIFSSNKNITSNGTDTFYRAEGDGKISYSSNGTAWTATGVTSVAAPDEASFDFSTNTLYVGGKNGVAQISIGTNGIPTGSSMPGSNAAASVGSYYIITTFASNGAVYAGAILSANSKNNCLWGYYAGRRNFEWNKE